MYACDACGEEFETLSELRIDHEPCAVAEEQRRREEALRRLDDERDLAVGDRCRVIGSGKEVEIVDVEPGGEDADSRVVWVPTGTGDDPDRRETSTFDEIV